MLDTVIMYRLLAHRIRAEYMLAMWLKSHAGCQTSKIPCPCRTSESFMDGRLGCPLFERQQTTLANYEGRYGRRKKRHRRDVTHDKTGEVSRHSSTRSGAPASKLKSKELDVLMYPEAECSRVLPTHREVEECERIDKAEPAISYEKVWEVKYGELFGPEYLHELPEGDIDAFSEHVDPVSFHEVESNSVATAEEEYMYSNFAPTLELPKGSEVAQKFCFDSQGLPSSEVKSEIYKQTGKDLGQLSSHLKKKKKKIHLHKKITFEKGRRMDATSKMQHKDSSHKMKLSKAELAARKESFMQSLLSYLDTCVDCGLLNRGMSALMFYRERGKRGVEGHGNFRVQDARVYEVLLHGYATKRNISKVEELMRAMTEDGIVQTAQCYAACFECVGRRLDWSLNHIRGFHALSGIEAAAKKKLRMWASEMSHKDLTLNDLFAATYLLSDQKKFVMESVLKIDPHFKPVWPHCPEFDYTCRLLQDLNYFKPQVYHSPVSGLFDGEQLKKFTLEQLQTELNDCLEVKSIELREDPNELVLYLREKLAKSHKEWREVILNALPQDLQTLQQHCQRGVVGHRFMNLYPFLVSVKQEELVELVLQEIRKLAEGSETFSPSTNQLYRELGSRVLERYQVNWKEKMGILNKVKHLYNKYCDWIVNPESVTLSEKPVTCTRQAWQSLVHSHQDEGASLNFRERSWPVSVQIGIGKFLYDIILREIRIDINISRPSNKKSNLLPAFYTLFRSQQHGKIMKEEVKPHPVLARLFRGAASDTLKFPAKCVPMLCPPTPWTSVMSGAYLLTKADVIRLPAQAMLQWNRLANCPTQQLYPALDSLNQLGAVPWKVNKQVLDVVVEVFNSGGSSQLAIPAPPSAFTVASTPLVPPPKCPDASSNSSDQANEAFTTLQKERFQRYRHNLYLRRKKAEAYSLWCDMLYRLSLANHFRDRVFWLPHNMDFRGRVYPCPPHLNHLGSDMARSLLCFAKGQPLGPKGLDWLKLHLVNLTGLMKRNSIKERMVFAEEMMPKIIDSAENPLKGDMWWAKSDEPWQTLAVCMEINAAQKNEGGPENYVCHFPVHQDGSCNGLQHYAALGRDVAGAASVSMAPSDCPQDVYAVVAAMVEREREADAKLNVAVAQILEGFVRRKVIKQTVMTTVYGVTRFGARLQIARQLRDIDEFPKEHVWRASSYLVGKTFGCLREMFTSTKEIQDWFTDCAHLISQVCGRSVEWVTPLGLPVVQPYHRVIGSKRHGVADPLSFGFMVQPYGVVGNHERPNVMKQKNAFPPNFIHSIDSSHMMLTSLWCERKGLTFVSVHDCYWTHPSTVEIMNKICREQFVALHSEPILEDLSSFLVQNYSYSEEDFDDGGGIVGVSKRKLNTVLTKVPKKGDFNLRSVLDSVYFFS